ncbi:MAG: DUF1844 domain-containing protein [Candidatus Aminicenantes bacterium]
MKNKEKNNKDKTKQEKKDKTQEVVPPLDFSSLVLPFYTQALIKLGLTKDPLSDKEEVNLDLAKRLIDLLDLLNQRTKGNLKPEEEKFLSSCLQQLKLSYMEKARIIKL